MPRSVLLPLPDRDFDVTEVAVPWKLLTERGVSLKEFADQRREYLLNHPASKGL